MPLPYDTSWLWRIYSWITNSSSCITRPNKRYRPSTLILRSSWESNKKNSNSWSMSRQSYFQVTSSKASSTRKKSLYWAITKSLRPRWLQAYKTQWRETITSAMMSLSTWTMSSNSTTSTIWLSTSNLNPSGNWRSNARCGPLLTFRWGRIRTYMSSM